METRTISKISRTLSHFSENKNQIKRGEKISGLFHDTKGVIHSPFEETYNHFLFKKPFHKEFGHPVWHYNLSLHFVGAPHVFNCNFHTMVRYFASGMNRISQVTGANPAISILDYLIPVFVIYE
jgi:hypothetical protein